MARLQSQHVDVGAAEPPFAPGLVLTVSATDDVDDGNGGRCRRQGRPDKRSANFCTIFDNCKTGVGRSLGNPNGDLRRCKLELGVATEIGRFTKTSR